MCKDLMGDGDKDGVRIFSVVSSDRMKGNGHKLEGRAFYLNIRKILLQFQSLEHAAQRGLGV